MSLLRSLANLKREISEKKWVEARHWAGGRTCKMKYCMLEGQRPDDTLAGSTKWPAPRFHQVKTGHCLTGQLSWLKNLPPAMQVVLVPALDSGALLRGASGVEVPTEDLVGGGAEGDWERGGLVEDTGPPGG